MYKATVRWLIKRNIDQLNQGNYQPVLNMFASDADLNFPGDNSWSRQYRAPSGGREASRSHVGRDEIEGFLRAYVDTGFYMQVDDILVNGPPWNARAAARVHHWVTGPDGTDIYANRAILFVSTRWGKIRHQEDYEDTEKVAAFDQLLSQSSS